MENKTETAKKATTKTETKVPAFSFKVKKNVTLPLVKPAIDVPVFIKVTSAQFTGKKIESGEHAKMEPAELINCINLETGEDAQMIIPSVLQGIFEDEYPQDAYVGLCFSITKHAKASSKKYHPFSVAEIEVE